MTQFTIYYKVSTKTVRCVQATLAAPVGFTSLGAIQHDHVDDPLGDAVNHVMYHHVRDKLYAAGYLDPSAWTIYIDKVITADRVNLTPATYTLSTNNTLQLTKEVLPSDTTVQTVTYASSDPTKATVNGSGLVTGVAAGTTTITVTSTSGSKTDTSVITVVVTAATSVELTPATLSIAALATSQLTATVLPSNASNKAVTYVSSDPTKATVSAGGLVTGVAAGSTTITVTSTDGSFTDTCVVTVTS